MIVVKDGRVVFRKGYGMANLELGVPVEPDVIFRIIPRRAAGYTKGKDGYANCEYLSMTWPHAAGALMSTVDDLALWDAALYTDAG